MTSMALNVFGEEESEREKENAETLTFTFIVNERLTSFIDEVFGILKICRIVNKVTSTKNDPHNNE